MKVKNGIASSVSLEAMPWMRKGSACTSCAGMTPSPMPTPANSKPHPASVNATGMPLNSSGTSTTNMSGARCKTIQFMAGPAHPRPVRKIQASRPRR